MYKQEQFVDVSLQGVWQQEQMIQFPYGLIYKCQSYNEQLMCGSDDQGDGKQKWFYIVQVTKNMDEEENAESENRGLLDNFTHDVTKYMQYAQRMSGFMSDQIGDLINPSVAPSAEIEIWPSETSKILNSDPSTLSN